MVEKECQSVWMLKKVQKRKSMEHFLYPAFRDVLKVEGDRMREFVAKYWAFNVQTPREKFINIQYKTAKGEEGTHNIFFMCTESLLRRRSQEARSGRD